MEVVRSTGTMQAFARRLSCKLLVQTPMQYFVRHVRATRTSYNASLCTACPSYKLLVQAPMQAFVRHARSIKQGIKLHPTTVVVLLLRADTYSYTML